MKSLILVLGLLLFSLFLNAQESGRDAVVASVNMNLLYLGISNTVETALKYTITGFIFFVSSDGMDYEERSYSNKLTYKMKSFISGCEPGKQIVFKNIKFIGPDGRSKDLQDIILTIK